jgi:hypothetical protein
VCYLGLLVTISRNGVSWKWLVSDSCNNTEYIDTLPIGRKYLVERSEIGQRETIQPERAGGIPLDKDSLTDEERAFLKYIIDNSEMPVTHVYAALHLSSWKGDQIRDALKTQGLIFEQVTRLGQKGRPATICIGTDKARLLLGKERPKGRGGEHHVGIQEMVETYGLAKGFQVMSATEKLLDNGHWVDVHLENQHEKVAVEVAVKSKPQRELAHIRNCLDAGYNRIFCLFVDEHMLTRTRDLLPTTFTGDELRKVMLLPVWKIGSFL